MRLECPILIEIPDRRPPTPAESRPAMAEYPIPTLASTLTPSLIPEPWLASQPQRDYCTPRSAICLRLVESIVSTLWQVEQSLEIDLPEAVL